MKTNILLAALGLTLGALAALPLGAQQTTGTPGSPGATTTISGKQLPAPDPKFGGVIENDALNGPLQPWFDKKWRPGEIELVKRQSFHS